MALIIQTTGLEDYAPGGKARVKVLVIGGPGVGKRLDVETKVATPTGWRRFGDLNVDDHVIGSDGKATRVLGIYDEGTGPALRLTLNDATSVICDSEHLWSVQTRKGHENGSSAVVMSTADMLDAGVRDPREGLNHKDRYKFYLPLVKPVQFETDPHLPLGPYLLASLLANGSFTGNSSVYVTTNDEQVIDRCVAENLDRGIVLTERTHPNSTARRWAVSNGHALLRELGIDQLLSGDKHVPDPYMTASESDRRELLAGLLDGDGSVGEHRRAIFHTTSTRLARDVQELVQSLGGVARITAQDRTHQDKGVEFSVAVWTPDNPFRLPRKADNYEPRPWFRAIESIEPVADAMMRCIKVDAADELYVVEDYIVTHNTRWASYFPEPMYADCEGGLASVADRGVAFVRINSSQDMLDLLAYLKQECRQPAAQRKYNTIVIDTLDAFQRKVKNEWMEKNNKQVFTGWEAWGYVNSKLQMLMTRLLNLDMNVIVAVHYKDKTTTDDDTGKSTHSLQLQVQGELSETAFNDFDLVAWMGTYWEAVEGQRVQKRGLTFKATPEMPFLKDRLHVTPNWLEVQFKPTDYSNLFDAIQARVADIGEGQVLGEIPSETAPVSPFVVAPGAAGSGPLAPVEPKSIPFGQMDRPTLMKVARDSGVTTTVDGAAIRANTLKSELVAALEAHASAPKPTAPAAPTAEHTAAPADPAPTPAQPVAPAQSGPVANPARTTAAVRTVEEGLVDIRTGELLDTAAAVKTVETVLGGHVIEETLTPVEPAAPPVVSECESCSKDLAGENPDFVKLSYIKFRKRLCADCYQTMKNKR